MFDLMNDSYDSSYDDGSGHYLEQDLYETPNAVYDTFGDDVAVDGYQDGIISESQMADDFASDASFNAWDDIINGS